MRRIALIALLLVSTHALAATAIWTGKSQPGTSITGQFITNCEFDYFGKKFWRAFSGSCPSSVEVQ